MNEIKWIWYWVCYFFVHTEDKYLINHIMYEKSGLNQYYLYRYCKILMIFNIVIYVDMTNSDNIVGRWIFDYQDVIILKKYYK